MNIFIAYPKHVLLEKAETLSAKLTVSNYKHFIDIDSINIGAPWNQTIRDNIEESDVYIILTTKGVGEDKYINNELNWIRSKRMNNPNKKIITVIFPPGDKSDLSAFFKEFQFILVKEEDSNYEDNIWTAKVIDVLDQIKEEDELKNTKIKRNSFLKQIEKRLAFSFAKAIPFILAFSLIPVTYLIFKKPIDEIIKSWSSDNQEKTTDKDRALNLCNDLKGTGRRYNFENKYTIISEDNIEAISSSGYWNTGGGSETEKDCQIINESYYEINGEEYTKQELYYVKDNNKIHVGTAENWHPSTLVFDINNSFSGSYLNLTRRFEIPKEEKVKVTCDDEYRKYSQQQKNMKSCSDIEKEYKVLNSSTHTRVFTQECKSTVTKNSDGYYLFHICGKSSTGQEQYFRIMKAEL